MPQTAPQLLAGAVAWRPATPASSEPAERARLTPGGPLQDALCDLVKEFGFQGAVYAHLGHAVRALRESGPVTPLRFVASSVFDRRLYGETGALEFDPMITDAVRSNTPVAWSTAADPRLTDAQRQLHARLRGRGIQAGVIAAVQDYAAGPAFLNFYSAFTGEAERCLQERAAQLVFAAGVFHERAKLLALPTRQAARPLLTSREIDCLRLAAMGLTAQETAGVLEVTVRTVEFHLKNAAEKFGASNKVRAVALAVSRGLIQL